MYKIDKYINGFLALIVLVFAFTRLPLFDSVVQTEWFNNLATTYSATGLSLEDIVLFFLLVLTTIKQYLEGNLPYAFLYFKHKYRYIDEYQERSFRERLFIGWYLYAVEKKLVSLGVGRPNYSMSDPQFIIPSNTTIGISKLRGIFFGPTWLLWLGGLPELRRLLKRQLKIAESESMPDDIAYKDLEPTLCLVLTTFGVAFGTTLLRSLWRYSLSVNTDLDLDSAKVLYFYTVHQKIEVSLEQYLQVITDFCQYLNEQQVASLISIRDSIDSTLDNCHKLSILEQRFFKQ